MDSTLVSRTDVRIRLGLSQRTVDRYIAAGEIPAVRIGTRVLIHPEDIDKFITDRRVAGIHGKDSHGK